jgi:hypothetical protein
MDKGYYQTTQELFCFYTLSQSTIKMDKGYYQIKPFKKLLRIFVAIHNKNGQGLLRTILKKATGKCLLHRVAIHNKNGKGLLPVPVRITITFH